MEMVVGEADKWNIKESIVSKDEGVTSKEKVDKQGKVMQDIGSMEEKLAMVEEGTQ